MGSVLPKSADEKFGLLRAEPVAILNSNHIHIAFMNIYAHMHKGTNNT